MLYDTFSFKLTLPPSSAVMEFCVCFRSEGSEYWDSYEVCDFTSTENSMQWINFIFFIFLQGKNYRIIKKRSTFGSHSPGILMMEHQKFAIGGGGGGGVGDQQPKIPNTQTKTSATNPIAIPNGKYNDLTQSKMTSYSEFASWNHLDNECPYW